MTLNGLRAQLVELGIDLDIDSLFHSFCRQNKLGTVQSFIADLHRSGVISDHVLIAIHGGTKADIDASALAAASPPAGLRTRNIRPPPKRTAPILASFATDGETESHIVRDPLLRRKVHMRKLRASLLSNHFATARFVSEAQIVAQLDHPNILPVYSLELAPDNTPMVKQKLADAQPMSHLLAQVRGLLQDAKVIPPSMDVTARLHYFLQICQGVSYAHHKGILHRQLAPNNILVGQFSEVWVSGWRQAKVIETPDKAIRANATPKPGLAPPAQDVEASPPEDDPIAPTYGAARYMSPEQAKGHIQSLNSASDTYCLGLLLQEMITLEPAVAPEDFATQLAHAQQGKRRSVRAFQGDREVSRSLEAILNSCCAPEAKDRYASVELLIADVQRFLRNQSVSVLRETAWQLLLRWISRYQRQTVILIAILLAMTSIATSALVVSGMRHDFEVNQAGKQALSKTANETRRLRIRERQLSRFMSTVTDRQQALDLQLITARSALKAVAEVITSSLAYSTSQNAQLVPAQKFTQGVDSIDSQAHEGAISVQVASYDKAEVVNRSVLAYQLSHLTPLPALWQRLLIQSAQPSDWPTSPSEIQNIITNKKTPIRWAHLALNSGLTITYPGTQSTFNNVSSQPWYLNAVSGQRPVWSAPEGEVGKASHLLPVSLAIQNIRGQEIGVASLRLSMTEISRRHLSLPSWPAVREIYLVDQEGKIQLTGPASEGAVGSIGEILPIPEVVDAIGKAESGTMTVLWRGAPMVAAYFQLKSLPWTYVALAETAVLEGKAK